MNRLVNKHYPFSAIASSTITSVRTWLPYFRSLQKHNSRMKYHVTENLSSVKVNDREMVKNGQKERVAVVFR
jgi:hypothetical protein